MEVNGHSRNEVGPLEAGAAQTGSIAPALDVNRNAAKVREDRVELPISKNLVADHSQVPKWWEDIDGVGDEGVPAVKVRAAAVQIEVERIGGGIGKGG